MEVVEELLEGGADPNQANEVRATLSHEQSVYMCDRLTDYYYNIRKQDSIVATGLKKTTTKTTTKNKMRWCGSSLRQGLVSTPGTSRNSWPLD